MQSLAAESESERRRIGSESAHSYPSMSPIRLKAWSKQPKERDSALAGSAVGFHPTEVSMQYAFIETLNLECANSRRTLIFEDE